VSLVFSGLVSVLSVSGQARHMVKGMVFDAETKEPVLYANVVIHELTMGASTNDKGEFTLRSVPEGSYLLTITYIGYEEYVQKLTVNQDQSLRIGLREQSLGLEEVIVTAENSKGGSTSSRIKSEAISHVQASSLKDVLQLVPGNLLENPNLRDPSRISIREVGDNANSALGTAIIVDGIPVSNDGNMQVSMKTSGGITSAAGTGVDIRGISVDNIESITVDVGIPSAEHGNLTSGAVHIKTKAGGSPAIAKFKADPQTKQVYLSKGVVITRDRGVVNMDLGYTHSFGHITKRTSLYNRMNGTAKYSRTLFRDRSPLVLESRLSWDQTLDGEKWDPDMLLLEENREREQKLLGTVSLKWSPGKTWLSSLSFDGSYSKEWQKGFEKSFAGSSSGATFFSTATSDGEFEISYAPSSFYSEVNYDSRPFNLFLKFKANAYRKMGPAVNNLLLGAEWKSTGNNGTGRTFNPERPPVGVGTRPRPFFDIPALDQLSFFAEDKFSIELGPTLLNVTAGIRMDNIEPSGIFKTDGSLSFDPRINIRYQLLKGTGNSAVKDLSLRAGYGQTTKAPALIHLYPDKDYNDVVSFNYYPELIVATTTIIQDTRNPDLKPARSTKKEVGLDFRVSKVQGRVTLFSEKHSGGFDMDNVLFPQFYRDYDVLAAGYKPWFVPGDGIWYTDKTSGQPVRLGYENDVKFSGYSRTMNSEVRIKKGVEYSIDLGKFKALKTAVIISGAWFRTESYDVNAPYWSKVDYTVFEGNTSKQESFAVKFPDQFGYGTIDERLNTNVGFNTHIPELKMLVSLTAQFIWFEKNRREIYPWKNKLFSLNELRDYLSNPDLFSSDPTDGFFYYLPESHKGYDDVETAYAVADFADPLAQQAIKKTSALYFPQRILPPLFLCNIKVSKDISRRYKLSFYANNFLNIRPWHIDERSGRYLRRNETPFFGADLTMEF